MEVVKKKALDNAYYPKSTLFCSAIMNCLEQTGTSYIKELDTLLAPNFQSFKNIIIQPWRVYDAGFATKGVVACFAAMPRKNRIKTKAQSLSLRVNVMAVPNFDAIALWALESEGHREESQDQGHDAPTPHMFAYYLEQPGANQLHCQCFHR